MSQDGNSDHTKSWAYKQMSKEQRKSHDSGRNGGDNYRSGRNGNGGYINGGFRPDNHSSTTQDKNGNSSSQGKSWYKR